MNDRAVLITGGAGYIGSKLAQRLLASGWEVRVLDRLLHGGDALLGMWSHPRFHFVLGDVRDRAAVDAALDGEVYAVVHLAAIVGDPACAQAPDEARSTNLDGALNVYEAAKRCGAARFLFASTCSNYGKMKDSDGFVDESSELAPISLYAETKVAVEQTILDERNGGGFAPTCLRFATVYGVSPRMRFDLTVNEFTMVLALKKHLVVFGEQFWRPYIHVGDAARAILRVLESPRDEVAYEVFNVGSTDENYQKRMIVDAIVKRIPGARIERVKKDEDPRDYRVNFGKIQRVLGFHLTRTVEDGIDEVLALARSRIVDDFSSPKYRNSS